MIRQHPAPHMDVPISIEIYQKLLGAAHRIQFEKEYWEIAEQAIEEWTRRHSPDAIPMPGPKGYQWKSQFLPDGTLLRTVFGGKNHHAFVEGDQILHDGHAVSPSVFANTVGGMRRNAWRCIWILFPDSKDWKLADSLRARTRPRRARKAADGVRQVQTTQPAADTFSSAPMQSAAQTDTIAAGATQVPDPIHEPLQQTDTRCEGRPRNTGIVLPRQQRTSGADRRTSGDGRIAAMLRQELLPLLYRLCAADGMPQAA
jgi:hypothetical protein